MEALNTDQLTSIVLHNSNEEIAEKMGGDVVFINSTIMPPLDDEFRVAIEDLR